MRNLLCPLLVLALICGFAGMAQAEQARAPENVPTDIPLAKMLEPATPSCDAPAAKAEGEPQIADLERQLRQPMAGQPCNQTTCNPDEFCCNFSCSICAPRGGFCIQIICE
jgi:hypothetical protein